VDLQNNRAARICRIENIDCDWSDQYTDYPNDKYCCVVRRVSVEPHSCASLKLVGGFCPPTMQRVIVARLVHDCIVLADMCNADNGERHLILTLPLTSPVTGRGHDRLQPYAPRRQRG
jgi:hypothetical protein